jgi:hypothetical protein
LSTYQYYEFLAIDRPLDGAEQAAIRSLSTRARITASSFVNEYHWGDFGGDPVRLVKRYYDAHLYLASWGTRCVIVRLPSELLDPSVAGQYCVDERLDAWAADEFTMISFSREDEDGSGDEFADPPDSVLSQVVGVRAELAAGDLRPLYLGWLAAYGTWERDEHVLDAEDEDDLEPPVPPGLGSLTAAQRALADLLELDQDLLATAAQASPPIEPDSDGPGAFSAWVSRLPSAEKDRWLTRVARGEPGRVRMELLRRFRDDTARVTDSPAQRTVADLLDAAARRRSDRKRHDAARRAEGKARQERARALARERRLDQLADEEDVAWSRVDALIDAKKPLGYDTAVELLTDLRTVADREDRHEAFAARITGLRRTHARKPALMARFDRAGI